MLWECSAKLVEYSFNNNKVKIKKKNNFRRPQTWQDEEM